MNLKRNGYEREIHKTGFDISDKSEEKIGKMSSLMEKAGFKSCWNDCDDEEILSFIIDTFDIDDFKFAYQSAKKVI